MGGGFPMKKGFDNKKYIKTQSKKIKEILLKFKAKYSIYKSHQDL
jgi:uncharacterized protein (UPF0371 family)